MNAAGTAAGNGASVATRFALSDDGRYVAFASAATDLVMPAVPSGATDRFLVYLRDLEARTTVLLTSPPAGLGAVLNGDCANVALSGDGSTVVFTTRATNLGHGPFTSSDPRLVRVYRWRRATNAVDLALAEADGTAMELIEGGNTMLSRDGRWLAVSTRSRIELPRAGRPADESNVYLVDLTLEPARRVPILLSRNAAGSVGLPPPRPVCNGDDAPGAGSNIGPSWITPDGSRVIAWANGYGYVPGDLDNCADSYVFTREPFGVRRVEGRRAGTNDFSLRASVLDETGEWVTATTFSSLSPTDTDLVEDVYFGRVDGTVPWVRVSEPMPGAVNDGVSVDLALDARANRVLFSSSSSRLVPRDTNGAADLYVRDLRAGTTTRVSVAVDGSELDYGCTGATCPRAVPGALAANGRVVAFHTVARADAARDTNRFADVYVHRLP